MLVACRTGHYSVASIFLEAGAKADIPNNEGLTSLHFLSTFDDDDIPLIAWQCQANGADVEARSTAGIGFNSRIDCQYGIAEGTPLLWAIGAGNLVATRTLLELGSDPFDLKGGKLSVSTGWGKAIHYFPVDLAALLHQHRLLETMLHYTHEQINGVCALRLNDNYRSMATTTGFASLPLFWAIDYRETGFLERLLLHGSQYQEACKQTIRVLTSYGANPTHVNIRNETALEVATAQGHYFLNEYLIQNHENISKSTTIHILQLLFNAVRANDYATFDLLVSKCEGIMLEDESALYFFSLVAESTDNASFDFSLDDEKWASRSIEHDNEILERSILQGSYMIARKVFEEGKVKLASRTANDAGHDAVPLGKLIARSRRLFNTAEKVRFLLSD